MTDRLLSRYVEFPIQPGRERAIRLCIEWVIRHQDADGAWGGIQPPWIYSLMALHTEGYGITHPVVANGIKALDAHWSYERDGGLYIQASESPVWDTVLTLQALLDSGQSPVDCESMTRAIDWIVQKQVTAPGDWQVKVSSVMPGGWSFERANDSYPDVDDTAVAILVLARGRKAHSDPTAIDYAMKRAVRWILALQSSNGGWASFDRDNTNSLLTKLPFCDFGEVLDPPTVDVTAHVVEALAHLCWTLRDRPIARALAFMKYRQEEDGSWFGRWGVNHIYGTAAVLPALAAIGEDLSAKYVGRAGDWIVEHQNADGGWGETPASYVDDSLRGVGDSTASQTAWALMALLAIPTSRYDQFIQSGIEYLLSMQHDGTWHEPQYTGTRISRVWGRLPASRRVTRAKYFDSTGTRGWKGIHDQLQSLPALLPADGLEPRPIQNRGPWARRRCRISRFNSAAFSHRNRFRQEPAHNGPTTQTLPQQNFGPPFVSQNREAFVPPVLKRSCQCH